MDSYQTLGVPKNCTREELEAAFRAKARLAHPDAGGEPAAFIQLREAFDQVRKELERRPPPDAKVEPRAQPVRPVRPPKEPDPSWEPELIVRDEPLPRLRPARRRDPDWQPDLIVSDTGPRQRPVTTTRDATISRQKYVGFLSRFSNGAEPENAMTRVADWNLSGLMALLVVTIITVWILWAAWRSQGGTKPSEIATKYDPVHNSP